MMVKFSRNKNAILLGVAVVVIMWLVIPSLRHETVLVPVRSEVPRGELWLAHALLAPGNIAAHANPQR